MKDPVSPAPFRAAAIWLVASAISTAPVLALQTLNYTGEKNDRFSSGYPTSPVENASPNFVGASLDWAGVGWNPAVPTKSYGFLSPQHYLVARHFEGSANVSIFAGGTLQTYSQWKVENTGLGVVFQGQTTGDISLGTLNSAIPGGAGLPRYAVLDLNGSSTSNTTTNYTGLNVLLYGRGPDSSFSTRVGEASISTVTASGNSHLFTTTRLVTQLESGDSGSPAVHRWLNPAGVEEITLVGNHAGINDTSNAINFTGTHQVMSALNNLMNDDGFALRVVGNPTHTWVGSSSTAIDNRGAWGLTPPQSAPTDQFVNFSGSTAGNDRKVTVNNTHNLRGLYFLPTASSSAGFTFEGGSTLTIGRGGITNYDASRQTFDAALALASSQLWNGGAGGITTAGIATNGHLLEIMTAGESRVTGSITGSGSLALSGGALELTGASTYSGTTWVHDGTLVVNNASGSATGTGDVIVSAGATFTGGGAIQGNLFIAGTLAPGNSIGTLGVDGNVTWNATVAAPWQFELGTAAGTQAAATLGIGEQDLLAITGNFIRGSGSSWVFDFQGTGEIGWYQLVDWDGTTSFIADDFVAINLGDGRTGGFLIDESSSSLLLQVIPEPGVAGLLILAMVACGLRRRR